MTQPAPTRRQILKRGAGAAGAAALSVPLLSTEAKASESVDAVVIGSGYAGAVAALRLSQAGINSVVLERGRRWTITPSGDTFAPQARPDGRASWLSTTSPLSREPVSLFTGVLEAYAGGGVTCLAGAGVGGGSLVNYAVMEAPSEQLFRASFGTRLDYAEMAGTWYPRARGLIGVAPIPDDVLASPYYANARDFLTAAERAGLGTRRVDMAIDWQTVRAEIAGTAVRSAIVGDAMLGINSGAKRSVDRTILAAAEATGRTEVLPLHQVLDIRADGDRYVIDCRQIDEQGHELARPRFTARHVFLAAGSLGTTRLLVRAKARGHLPRLNDQVGRNWGSGGDHIVARAGLPLTGKAQGGPAHILATDWDNPKAPVSLLSFPLGYPALGPLTDTALAMSVAPPIGRFTYRLLSDSAELYWPAADPRILRVTAAVQGTAQRLNAATGLGLDIVTPLLTSHSTGGVVLGEATDSAGQLIGHDNLFAVDSSLLPGSTGAMPPALTTTALADRSVSRALENIITAG
ncbi:GMC family oxidoreductase N-terminal domain-containing protein [Streptomyces sp. NBC_00201]|uniref:GMC family oxidoreductase N-terminal domain-containing protein n=1 Tax=unclassified Streptomyces TaxID=2593676 RepID=UPI00225671DF|nr:MULTISPECIES: GMC family oxidoreductase N-terminal domain-containing protein [unclassified Streptomyces]MCX5249019.1 GMC family oxidoreductase N-terminal domain-containing protein [Streptomyces sp. NBC_00201]